MNTLLLVEDDPMDRIVGLDLGADDYLSLANYRPAFVDLTDPASEECVRLAAHLELGLDPHSSVVPGVAKLLRRMMRNLLENARRDGGVGLGLSLVRSFVQRHWGRVQCQDRTGDGAQFVVMLPVSAQSL